MHRIVIDTSVYVPLLRRGKMPAIISETSGSVVYLSAVVAQELYAGAVDQHTADMLDELYNVFENNGRLITPTGNDWKMCGKTLSQIGRRYGFESIRKGRLVNDVLIALSCRQIDAVLLTANHKDFRTIHEFVKFKFLGI